MVAGVVFALGNHLLVVNAGYTLQILAVIGPVLGALGIVGVADPRTIAALDPGKRERHPQWCYIAGVAAIVVGTVVGLALAIMVYGLEL